ncbi:uncharacterized protein [Ptychodera flava]|uniref:uncharacterized protein isoform X1 n=1 Tax=Ptychodera flava TaxID=63121 RepID=UPI00396A4400
MAKAICMFVVFLSLAVIWHGGICHDKKHHQNGKNRDRSSDSDDRSHGWESDSGGRSHGRESDSGGRSHGRESDSGGRSDGRGHGHRHGHKDGSHDGKYDHGSKPSFWGLPSWGASPTDSVELEPRTKAPPPPTEPPPEPTESPTTHHATMIPTLAPCEYPVPISNVAEGRPTFQSSDKPKKDGGSEKAVDGNKDSDLKGGNSCTWTDDEFEPYWQVDLESSYDIYEVVITNRMDCCSGRIKNAQIRVGDSSNFEENPICGRMIIGKMSRDETITTRCGCETPMRGRYVSVQLIDKEQMLHLCEVEVMAG